MERPVSEFISETLHAKLERYGVVVFYNPDADMRSALDLLPDEVEVLTFGGSYLKLKLAAEARFAELRHRTPGEQGLLLYVPAQPMRPAERDPLLEYALAGTAYDHSLQAVARQALDGRFTRVQIDALFQGDEPPTLADLDTWGARDEIDPGSLGVIYDTTDPVTLVRTFLENAEHDGQLNRTELARFLNATIGLELDADASPAEARRAAWRHVLLTALAASLGSDVRDPAPQLRKAQRDAIDKVVRTLREVGSDAYAVWADRVEREESLSTRVAGAGREDVFAFQNTRALHALTEIETDEIPEAVARVDAMASSYWSERQIDRKVQWRIARHALEVIREANRVEAELRRAKKELAALAGRYVLSPDANGNWYRLDQRHRALENSSASLGDASELRSLIIRARRAYGDALYAMTTRVSAAYEIDGLAIPGVRSQKEIYRDAVEPLVAAGPTAFFVMDALRYEMGLELADLLEQLGDGLSGGVDVHTEARVSALPSTTPFGMAALMPGGATLGLDANGVPTVGEEPLPDWRARKRYWEQAVPGFHESRLQDLPDAKTLAKRREKGLDLLLVRMQEIDSFGEIDHSAGGIVMTNLLGEIRRGVRTVLEAGFRHVVITADHGYLMSQTGQGSAMDAPEGTASSSGRRYWLGHPVAVPGAATGFPIAETDLFSQAPSNVELVLPKGPGYFRSGGNTTYFHGGASLQERIVPLITVKTAGPPAGRRADDAPELRAELTRDAAAPMLRAAVHLAGQGGLFGREAAKPKLTVTCVSDEGDLGVIVHPQTTSGEYEFADDDVIHFFISPQGSLDAGWTLRVKPDSGSVTEARWEPGGEAGEPAAARSSGRAPEASPAEPARSSAFGVPLPADAPRPPESVAPIIERIRQNKAMPEDDVKAFMKQAGLGRSAQRALRRYIDELAQSGYPLIVIDTTSMPPIYRIDSTLLDELEG